MATPSIKGTAIRRLVEDAKRQVDTQAASPADLAVLTDADRQLLEDGVLDSVWYPLDAYERLTRFMQRTEGQGHPDYVFERGEALAERLIHGGLYQQVDFLSRAGKAESLDQAVTHLRLVASMWGSFFNVGQWNVERDDAASDYTLVVTDAAELPDTVCQALHGVIARLARETGTSKDVRMHRATPEVVRYVLRFEP